jgi:2-C-methyl-D-erythritol 2,4-cyclodiphosphate synthase
MLRDRSFAIVNVDATLIAQRPKIAPFIEQMQMNIANALGILPTQINLKATTEEHLGFTGEGLGMAAHAVCLIEAI